MKDQPAFLAALTVEEAADYLRLSRATIYRLIREKKLRPVRAGGRTLFRRLELDDFLERHLEKV